MWEIYIYYMGRDHKVYVVDARYIENRPAERTGACRKRRLGVLHPRCMSGFCLFLLHLAIYYKLFSLYDDIYSIRIRYIHLLFKQIQLLESDKVCNSKGHDFGLYVLFLFVMEFPGVGWVPCFWPSGMHEHGLCSSFTEKGEFIQEPARIEDMVDRWLV